MGKVNGRGLIGMKEKIDLKHFIPDYIYIKLKYRRKMGKKLNLKSPKTYTEKVQWMKLYDRKPIYTAMVDKYDVKKYVSDIIGEEYIIPTLGVWNSFDEIEFDKLPSEFVLKCTHDSGGIAICRNKNEFNIKEVRKKFDYFMHRNYYYEGREWPYKNIKPRIIAEKYMEDTLTRELRDYKFFCFDGIVKILFIASDRQKKNVETKFDFFDREFNHLNIKNGHPNSSCIPQKPVMFKEMIRLAETLSRGIPHVRVDLYEIDGRIYFGEYTFSHFSGFVRFEPEEWDMKFGEWFKLPKKFS